jgi:hypothetical protein
MRFRILCSIAFAMLSLAACGGKLTPKIVPVPSASVLPLAASATPGATATVAAVTPTGTVGAQIISPAESGTPTPLATSLSGIGTRTPVKTDGTRQTTTQPTATAAPRTAQPTTAARMTDIPGAPPQQVLGTAQDGLVLLNVRVGKNEGFTRIVFDLARQDGSAAPLPRTRVWREGDTVVVAFGGVRDDVFGQSLGNGEQAINTGVVQSVYRIPVRDDSAAAYGFAVHGGAAPTLTSASSPTRVIVDIADK